MKILSEYFENRISNEYWIANDGRIIRFKGTKEEAAEFTSLHWAIARQELQRKFNLTEEKLEEIEYPGDRLHKLGYIRVGCAGGTHYPAEITQSQRNTLSKLNLRIP